jgi:hypothetical protein
MSQLRLRITLNKGKRGISLDKLEKVVEELRKFLVSLGDDMELTEPAAWVGVDFQNSSLEFTSQYQQEVGPVKLERFNSAIVMLARSEFPPYLHPSTAEHFFDVANFLDADETADIAVFDEDEEPVPLEISRRTATLARFINVLPYRETIGAVQGKIHSLYKESKPHPHFMLRELSTDNLIKCLYEESEYPAIVKALEVKDQVLHVRGRIMTDTRGRSIYHLRVEHILLAEPYGIEDVEKFLGSGESQ